MFTGESPVLARYYSLPTPNPDVMEPKKHASSDVHRYRGVLFSTGLICSLIIVVVAFHWQVQKVTVEPRYEYPDDPEPLFMVKSTTHTPREQTAVPTPRQVDPAVQIAEADPGEISLPAPEVHLDNIEPAAIDLQVEEPLEVLDWSDEMPMPEGGYEAFYKLLREEMQYPRKARTTETQGRVFVRFTVDKDGRLRDFSVVKGIGAGCDEEALRVLRLTRWQPGRKGGRPVAVRMIQPILFRLGTR